MKTMLALSWHKRIWVCGLIAASAIAANSAGAQSVAPRIRSEIGSSEPATLKGSLHPQAQPQFDAGRMPSNNKLNGVSIVFGRTAAQEADLKALIAAQQNSASPLYHQWLTPEQFAARFGMAESDLNKVEAWLEQQGFTIDSVARSRNVIIEFASMEDALACYNSPEYTAARAIRQKASTGEFILVEGV